MNGVSVLSADIRPTFYQPSRDYGLDLEILSMDSLRRKKGRSFLAARERIDFYMLIFFTDQTCRHIVDLEMLTCTPGSVLVLHPGQTHSFDIQVDWQGWLMLFRPEFLLPIERESYKTNLDVYHQIEELPDQVRLEAAQQELLNDCINRMWLDTQMDASPAVLNVLLQNQLHAFINRLYLYSEQYDGQQRVSPLHLKRFNRFRSAVEKHFHKWHKVSDYTGLLGCSEKSLSRLTNEMSGVSAKTFLSKRIALEAKRYLSNTGLPITNIAYKLGFDEVTNFTKFFKRETGCSPMSFRRSQSEVVNREYSRHLSG